MNIIARAKSSPSGNPVGPSSIAVESKMKMFDAAAALIRAEGLVRHLQDSYIADGFSPDHATCERMLNFFRKEAESEGSTTDEELDTVIRFCNEYNQSLDWLILGDAGNMICAMAKTSSRAREIALLRKRNALEGRGPSQFDLYRLPFFDQNASVATRCWTVASTGNYAVDCDTGARYAIEFLRSCDGSNGWRSLLANIAASMISVGSTQSSKSSRDWENKGVVIGFMSTIGTALTWQNITPDVPDALERIRAKENAELAAIFADVQTVKPPGRRAKRAS